ncbi:MAG: NAD(P)-dependent oxidoreductase [Deltaproteobacteria bacterium]|jgi:3-hydroxyisobutyrate dehydrogenase-like beta-hydroxyacid dehydrogenase|nr:NAD(P)-dependent oxidoreductase [Deltaproteobacteria bacterium]
MLNLGFLGLGIMGSAMAENLVRAGFQVTVWNRSKEKCDPLLALGAHPAENPRDVASQCDLTFAMLADPKAAREVCFGEDGVLAGISGGRGYIDMSTVDDITVNEINHAITEAGGRFLEAPVSGTKQPAVDGTLIILAAGDRSLYEQSLPAFEVMGKMSPYLGEAGQAAQMKLTINMVMGGMMTAFCEGIALGRKCGLDGAQLLEILSSGALANPMFKIKGPMLLAGEFPTSFPLKHMQKDLRLAVALGDRLGQPLHCASTANEIFKEAIKSGCADQDFSAVFSAID